MTQAPTPGQLSAHPCYDEHQPGCDCVIPEQVAAPLSSYLERLAPPAPVEASGSEREVAYDRLTNYPDYISDADGLARIRSGLLEVKDWHDLPGPVVNCNSLARLLDTIEMQRAQIAALRPQPSWSEEVQTADTTHSRRLFFGDPGSPQPSGETRSELIDYLGQEFGDTYDCKRVWSAWSYGTMAEDDFEPVSNRIDDIADAILALIHPVPVASGGQHSTTTDFPPDDVLACVPVAETAGEAVAWFRQSAQNPSAWYQVDAEERKYYERRGQRILPLLDPPVPAQDDDKLRRAASALLDACVKDFGDPAEFEGDDGSVARSKSGGCAVTFKHMRDLNLALKSTAAQEGGES